MKNLSLELWIRYKPSRFSGGSLFWRSTCKHIHWILNGLAWRIGDGHRMRTALDPFAGSTEQSWGLDTTSGNFKNILQAQLGRDKATVETEAGKLIIGIYKGEHHYNSSIGFYGSHL